MKYKIKFDVLEKDLTEEPDFSNDRTLRSLYVIVLTAKAALMFGETFDLADACSKFCARKASEVTASG